MRCVMWDQLSRLWTPERRPGLSARKAYGGSIKHLNNVCGLGGEGVGIRCGCGMSDVYAGQG